MGRVFVTALVMGMMDMAVKHHWRPGVNLGKTELKSPGLKELTLGKELTHTGHRQHCQGVNTVRNQAGWDP